MFSVIKNNYTRILENKTGHDVQYCFSKPNGTILSPDLSVMIIISGVLLFWNLIMSFHTRICYFVKSSQEIHDFQIQKQ